MTKIGENDAAIRALIETQTRALSAKNVDALIPCYTADMAHFSLAPPLKITGRGESWLRDWFELGTARSVSMSETSHSPSMKRSPSRTP